MHIIVCHENADFDAVASVLGAHKLLPDAVPLLPRRMNANVRQFLALYRSGLPFERFEDQTIDHIDRITLVDTQRVPNHLRDVAENVPTTIIDHHPISREFAAHEDAQVEEIGAATTLLVERIRAAETALSTLEATLLALGIYEDTGALTYRTTTPRDLLAAAWLIEQGAALDQVRRFLEPPLNDQQQDLLEELVVTAESRNVQGFTVMVAAARLDDYLNEISAVAHRLRDTLDPPALFLLVEMPSALHLVCRSTVDGIDVGEVARFFGGGGHERAAAATIREYDYDTAHKLIWERVERAIKPAACVADLMSYGVQTVEASTKVGDVVARLRRIGHEGYPVVEGDRLVGLLTRRDADRAMEHGLHKLSIREVMTAGEITLTPDDPVSLLEARMVESGWGQIPVINGGGKLIGIVTRTDLITHWAKIHPQPTPTAQPRELPPIFTSERIARVLSDPAAGLIDHIAQAAREQGVSAYIVGGVVRDLLLERANFDIDFVIEGDAIRFAESLAARFGGDVHSFRPFGTAKWRLADAKIGQIETSDLPDHVDFASARSEFYEQPTALPTVYDASIKRDLARRDFTINTLAIQLHPAYGRLLDAFGGLADLRSGIIRVLHSLSFVDDPTRILRAVRFARRLGFTIEPRTNELIESALPMLRRITGERVRNELSLLLHETDPAGAFRELDSRGILRAIHPAFTVDADLERRLNTPVPAWAAEVDPVALTWVLLLIRAPLDELPTLSERLLLPKSVAESLLGAAKLIHHPGVLQDDDAKPSAITTRLMALDDLARAALWITTNLDLMRTRLEMYANTWQHTRPVTDGAALKVRGIKPGPCYGRLIARLRTARLDGEAATDADEIALLDRLLQEGFCDDDVSTTNADA